MNKSFAAIAAFAALADSTEAAWSWGGCPTITNMADFDPARYSG